MHFSSLTIELVDRLFTQLDELIVLVTNKSASIERIHWIVFEMSCTMKQLQKDK